MNSTPAVMACSGLGLRRGTAQLLDGIDLSLAAGEKLGIVGPNGAGKSSLLRLLAGLLRPSAGSVQLDGRALASYRRRDVARALALVEQQAQSDDALRVRDVVELGRIPWLSALEPWSAEHHQQVAQALAAVGASHLGERLWHSLSGGERQRVQLARALAQQPRVLLLDEPTNHLDIRQQLVLLRLIRALPLACITVLHDLNQALLCDRLALLDRGRLVALGPPRDVLSAEHLRAVFGVHGQWLDDPFDGSAFLRLHPLTDDVTGDLP
ncbi:MAG: Fe(3+) dicitrate transport ATP-binding protein FecE [Stenotrophomonas maltophilia]|nr:MAG: Fe(3+) dicitrate transport ATP-binding protein FecE [Stenotrophomonas maltophilia]